MKDYKNVFERWQDGALPEELQKQIDSAFEYGYETSENCGYFKAGFVLAYEYDKYREELQNG